MRKRIFISMFIIVVVTVTAMTVLGTVLTYKNTNEEIRGVLAQTAIVIAGSGYFSMEEAGGQSRNLLYDNDTVRLSWISPDGKVLYDNFVSPGLLDDHISRQEIVEAMEKGTGEATRYSAELDSVFLYYSVRQNDGSFVRAATRIKTIRKMILSALPASIIAALSVAAICIPLSGLLTKRLVEPIIRTAESLDISNIETPYMELKPYTDKIRSQYEEIIRFEKTQQEFTDNVSHELKTPLTIISGYSQMLEGKLTSGSEERKWAMEISRNAERMNSIVNDTLTLSALGQKDGHKFNRIELDAIVRQCIDNLRHLAEQNDVSISYEPEKIRVLGNPGLLLEMVQNILENSIKYNRSGGSITIRLYRNEGRPTMLIQDTGIGIPAEECGKVFERFYRVDKNRSRNTGGTGLGLSIAKSIAELHDARIDIYSVLGQGTSVKVIFSSESEEMKNEEE